MSRPVCSGSLPRRTAFTLVELMVVIAIISLLIAMLLPVLSRGREMARRAMCGNNARTLGAVTLMYTSDYDGYVPDNLKPNGIDNFEGNYKFSPHNRRDLYLNYGASPWETWFCPSSVARGDAYLVKVVRASKGAFIYDMAYPGLAWGDGNRAFNGYGYWVGKDRGYAPGSTNAITYHYDKVLRITDAAQPSLRVVWGEAILPGSNIGGTGWKPPANGHTRGAGLEADGGWFSMVDNSVAWRRVEFGVNTVSHAPLYMTTNQFFAYMD